MRCVYTEDKLGAPIKKPGVSQEPRGERRGTGFVISGKARSHVFPQDPVDAAEGGHRHMMHHQFQSLHVHDHAVLHGQYRPAQNTTTVLRVNRLREPFRDAALPSVRDAEHA